AAWQMIGHWRGRWFLWFLHGQNALKWSGPRRCKPKMRQTRRFGAVVLVGETRPIGERWPVAERLSAKNFFLGRRQCSVRNSSMVGRVTKRQTFSPSERAGPMCPWMSHRFFEHRTCPCSNLFEVPHVRKYAQHYTFLPSC